ncbi:MAG: gamma-glutamyltransferase [Candidatus Rokuibacteriota bacterium]|nr:MAG: gamma-glutamyltransferase [Candidatus Rokubacteria bacterium]
MVATSHPLATRAGLRMLERGGNAADAALAAAAVLCVAEPMSTGIGGDAFALVWRDGRLEGLDAAGPAPASAAPVSPIEALGPRSVTVPGAVGGWAELADRYGRLGLDACLADAIDAAELGVATTVRVAEAWTKLGGPEELGSPPRVGEIHRQPELAGTLRAIAKLGSAAFYEGPVARAVSSACWLEEDDLAAYEPRWVEPLRIGYRGHEVAELPPPTQGVAALEGLGLLERSSPTLASQIRCVELALEDAFRRVRDGADVADLLASEYLDERRRRPPAPVAEPPGGTVYLCAVDRERMAVSFIQSLYESFGSRVVAPGTGIVLQNRGACFAVSGAVEPGRRPYHTIIPGMLLRAGELAGPFGVMGGFLQAQAHVQLVSALVDDGLDPQAALDRPRFRVDGGVVRLEEGLWERRDELVQLGHQVVLDPDTFAFGGGQAILVRDDALLGGSDPRKDGYAAGI